MNFPPICFKIGGGCGASPELRNEDPNNKRESSRSPRAGDTAHTKKPPPNNTQSLLKHPIREQKSVPKTKRKTWTKEEDNRLIQIIKEASLHDSALTPSDNFAGVAQRLGTGRTAKQCRDRWRNYLRDGIKKGNWTKEEEDIITSLYLTFGPKWATMAKVLEHRTDMDIKNKWYSMKRKEERGKVLKATDSSAAVASANPMESSLATEEPRFFPQDWQVIKSKKRKTL